MSSIALAKLDLKIQKATMTFSQIFTSDYLLNPTPPAESKLYMPFLIMFTFLIILGILTRLLKGDLGRMTRKYSYTFATCGILGLIYLFGRYEGLAWVGARITLFSILTILVVWTFLDIIFLIRFVPEYKVTREREDKFNKYLPKAKHKIR